MKKLIIIIFCLIFICSCSKRDNVYQKNIYVMDTIVNITVYSSNNADEVLDKIETLYNDYHKLIDRYNGYEGIINIYYINNILKQNEEIELDYKLYDLIKFSMEFSKKYDKVNIATCNLIDVWQKYRDNNYGIPSLEELNSIGSISEEDIILTEKGIIKKSDVKIDLSSIEKGYVTQIAGELLESLGYNKYIIYEGENIKVGKKYNNELYKIEIQDLNNFNKIYKKINAENISIATSGSYENFYAWNGKKYSHIIDSDTRYPSQHMKSVTVIMKDSGYADFFSTYLFMIPINDGIKFVNDDKNIEAIWYGLDGKIYTSSGFNNYE